MALLDHYKMEDMPKVIEHIENLMTAGLDGLKSAETADEDLAKNALFQMEHSLKAIIAYNKKKKQSEQLGVAAYLNVKRNVH